MSESSTVKQLKNIALHHHQNGRYTEAESYYRRVLDIDSEDFDALHLLGLIANNTGRHELAVELLNKALQRYDLHPSPHNTLGISLKLLGRLAEAEVSYRRALELKPDYAEVHNNLGITLKDQGRLAEADASYRRALELKPDDFVAYNNLGNVQKTLSRLAEAEVSYRQALVLKPDFPEAHTNLGLTLKDLGRLSEAEVSYRRALELRPDYPEAHNNLGIVLNDFGRQAEAESHYRRALELNPGYPEAHNNLGITLNSLGRQTEAEVSYRRALELKPDFLEAESNLLFNKSTIANTSPAFELEEARIYGEMVNRKVGERFSSWLCHPQPNRLRVGVVSGDLRNHPVSYFLEGVLAQLNSSRLELIAYPTSVGEDELTIRIKPCFSAWKPLFGQSDEAAARMIHEDGVHLLLDLSGHTMHSNLTVFAWKPAPVQATWLGYWDTTGVTEMDYILVDETGVPPGREGQFTEQVEYLPDTRLCFTMPDDAPTVSPLPTLTAIDGAVTFGSFQRIPKVNDQVLALWGRVFAAQPRARLLWQSKGFNEGRIVADTLERLARQGIDPTRVRLLGNVARKDYLATYAEVDVILDTFPFCGGTTTCEALWQGVPTLTLAGNTLVARQGASLMTAAGLPEWVVDTEDDFVTRAVELTGSEKALASLAELRSGLRERAAKSALFDAEIFARNLEAAFWGMWERRMEVSRLNNSPPIT